MCLFQINYAIYTFKNILLIIFNLHNIC